MVSDIHYWLHLAEVTLVVHESIALDCLFLECYWHRDRHGHAFLYIFFHESGFGLALGVIGLSITLFGQLMDALEVVGAEKAFHVEFDPRWLPLLSRIGHRIVVFFLQAIGDGRVLLIQVDSGRFFRKIIVIRFLFVLLRDCLYLIS